MIATALSSTIRASRHRTSLILSPISRFYDRSASLPDKYLWITLDRSV